MSRKENPGWKGGKKGNSTNIEDLFPQEKWSLKVVGIKPNTNNNDVDNTYTHRTLALVHVNFNASIDESKNNNS